MKKVQGFLAALVLVSTQLSAGFASASPQFGSCSPRAVLFGAGYQITGPKLSVLAGSYPKKENKNIPFSDMVTRIQTNISTLHGDLPDITTDKLAVIISSAALSSGVDFSVLSGIVRKESMYCKNRHNKRGGDSGCMQFTTPALNELKNQFGLNGPKEYAVGVPQILRGLVSQFYSNAPQREAQFYSWLAKDTTRMRVQLRTGDDQDIDIIAGALVLKINLAITKGNYTKALENYNGSKRRVAYARDVNAQSLRVSYDNLGDGCREDEQYKNEILGISCEMSNGEGCFSSDPNFQEEWKINSTST